MNALARTAMRTVLPRYEISLHTMYAELVDSIGDSLPARSCSWVIGLNTS